MTCMLDKVLTDFVPPGGADRNQGGSMVEDAESGSPGGDVYFHVDGAR